MNIACPFFSGFWHTVAQTKDWAKNLREERKNSEKREKKSYVSFLPKSFVINGNKEYTKGNLSNVTSKSEK